jgi:uncharacterized protein
MKFLCDDNLGKLAKYLRLLGFDTAFAATISDGELIAKMLREDRLVITRDRQLADRIEAGRVVLVDIDSPEEQLRQVIQKLKIPIIKEQFFSRCLLCNEVCREINPNDIKDNVFPYILKTKDQFRRCPKCGRLFWQGSHYKHMIANLDKIIGIE